MAANWTQEELRAAVRAYIGMREQSRLGEKVSKAEVYRQLASEHDRTASAFEYRMQNISHVYSLLGRSWVPGLLPAKNVGAAVAQQIEALIREEEGSEHPPVAAFNESVSTILKKPIKEPPAGNRKPKKTTSQTTTYERDPEIVAYVLSEAAGQCESCKAPAPFTKPDGTPFLEVHHLRRLADNGSDTVTNAVAICPNCHRELHYGSNQDEQLQRCYKNVPRLVVE